MDQGELLGWIRSFLTDLGVWTTLGAGTSILLIVWIAKTVMGVLRS